MLRINPAEIPAGVEYQWVSLSVCGDVSLGQVGAMRELGWSEVPAQRHPSLARESEHHNHIVSGALVLMERSKELGDQERAREVAKSRQQVIDARDELIRLLSA